MKNIKQFFSIITIVLMTLFVSCDDDKSEDLTDTINKNGSIESDISVRHLDSLHDILVTKHQVWTNYNTSKFIEYFDTIPALGLEHTMAENEDGDSKPVDVKKDYEIFITVK
jgi:hypothetical protein